MSIANIKKPPLFFENYNAAERIIINQGGTSSGKTYTLIDMFFLIAISAPNLVITVVGQDIPNLKSGAYRDAKNIWGASELYRQRFGKPNETDRIFKADNGSIIEFKSYGDEQDAKSGKRDYLFVNEANGISFGIFWQLEVRTRKKVYLDYNPTVRFWVHDELIGKPDTKLIISDHRHNPFLTDEQHARIEAIEDPELFKVYARGQTGKLEGMIFNNWDIVPSMPETYKKRFIGLDFGFANDPTAIVDMQLHEGDVYIHEIAYAKKLTNPMIADAIKSYLKGADALIIADSAEPKSIAELRNFGLRVEPANKGKDSVVLGLQVMERYKKRITEQSANTIEEYKKYRWTTDKTTSKALNVPIDAFNHSIDAQRYVFWNKFANVGSGFSFSII